MNTHVLCSIIISRLCRENHWKIRFLIKKTKKFNHQPTHYKRFYVVLFDCYSVCVYSYNEVKLHGNLLIDIIIIYV